MPASQPTSTALAIFERLRQNLPIELSRSRDVKSMAIASLPGRQGKLWIKADEQ